MASAFTKDIFRSIKGSLGRFVAIAAIVALGTGFYAGLRMTGPDMKTAADTYFDGTALMDLRVVSTLGLEEEDLEALAALPTIDEVMGAREVDVLGIIQDDSYAIRVHSLPEAASSSTTDNGIEVKSTQDGYLNRLVLAEGRWPEAADECVLSADRVMNEPLELGEVVTIKEASQDLETTLEVQSLTVVGYVHSSYYASATALGPTTLGSGTLQQFAYVPAATFNPDLPYTEAFLTVAGAQELASDSEAYEECIDEAQAEVEAIAPEREAARLASLKAEAQETLDEERADYEAQREEAEASLAEARQTLKDSQAELDAAAATLASSRQELSEGQTSYEQGMAELETQRTRAEDSLAQAQAELEAGRAQAEEAAQARPALAASLAQVEAALAQPDIPEEQRVLLLAQQEQLRQAIAAIDQGLATITAGEQQLDAQRQAAYDAIAQGEQRLAQAKAQLDEGRSQLAEGEARYAEGQAELQSGWASYEEKWAEAQEEFASAEEQLQEAQTAIDELEPPEWLIMDRTKNAGVVSFFADADRVDSIASIFPFIFFLVAALVALTTMTRMVDEERMLIGIYKALGYSRARITSKYLIYAALASVTGSVLGIALLSQLLPAIIMEAYSIVYVVPHGALGMNWPVALMAGALGVGVTLFATWAAAAATLKEVPAALMLPPAPKTAKRILLERVKFFWRRLSFSHKVTARNIFRYKKRFIMTVVGIAGCTALLLTGLGLQNAINDIIDKQYFDLVKYNVMVVAEDEADDSVFTDVTPLVSAYAEAQDSTLLALGAQGEELSAELIVPQDPQGFEELWTFRDRITGQEYELDEAGVLVTEKLAQSLGVGPGDTITLAEQDAMGNVTSTTYELPVGAVIENYVANYVFATPEAYEQAFHSAPDYRVLYAITAPAGSERDDFTATVSAQEGIKNIAYNDETIDTYRTMLSSVNMVVVVLVVAAALLAFIVLYNLTNINITERKREIATLKVLGFTKREVDLYIFREILLLVVIGALAGLVLGIFLESFVVVTAEIDQVMFGREIHGLSFAIAFVLTLLFSLVVMVIMRHKLSAINMVESLKSNE